VIYWYAAAKPNVLRPELNELIIPADLRCSGSFTSLDSDPGNSE